MLGRHSTVHSIGRLWSSHRGTLLRVATMTGDAGQKLGASSQGGSSTTDTSAPVKNVVVLGGSYAGAHASQVLSKWLPRSHRVILIERNSHMNHLYVIPRYSVKAGHEHKGFIPYTDLFKQSPPDSGVVVRGTVEAINANEVKVRIRGKALAVGADQQLSQSLSELAVAAAASDSSVTTTRKNEQARQVQENKEFAHDISSSKFESIPFDYIVYALGASLPKPLAKLVGDKGQDVSWLKDHQAHIKKAQQVLIVGGGALGVQFAADIKELYPDKTVTIVHSRQRLMNQFDSRVGDEAKVYLERLGVEIIFEDRVVKSRDDTPINGEGSSSHVSKTRDYSRKTWLTQKGLALESDYEIFCTGQKYNTHLITQAIPDCVKQTGAIAVNRFLQVIDSAATSQTLPSPASNAKWNGRLFAIGDVADTGSIKAGHTGWGQGEVAARNIVRLIEKSRRQEALAQSMGPSCVLDGHNAKAGSPDGNEVDIFPTEHEQEYDIAREKELAAEMAWKKDLNLEVYVPPPPMLKLTIGLKTAITQSYQEEADGTKTPTVTVTHDGSDDLNAAYMWGAYGASTEDLHA